ncbi:MAG: type II secretion system protein [Planctomycetota bacterium]
MSARRAFTLIELLVVIAVIAVLLGLLLPALGSARLSAQSAMSLSNLRQLQIANDLYATDHDEHYLPASIDIQVADVMPAANLHRWHGERDSTAGAFRARAGSITPYLDDSPAGGASSDVRTCPVFAPTLDDLTGSGAGFERGCGGYGYNRVFVGSRMLRTGADTWDGTLRPDLDDAGSRRVRFADPVATVAWSTSAFLDASGGLIEYSFTEPPAWPQWPEFSPDPSAHFRLSGRTSGVVWLDGHASAEPIRLRPTQTFTAAPEVFENANLGWFADGHSLQLFDYK